MIEDEGMDFGQLRETLLRLLPLLLIGMLLVINAMVIVTQVVPQWQLYADVQQNLTQVEAQIAAASSSGADDESFLAQQVEVAGEGLSDVAGSLLMPSQPEQVLENLYRYAGESGVTITGVLTQQSAAEAESDLYNVRMFRLHVLGNVPRLMNFVMRVEEARIPSVQIDNLSISENENTFDLTLDVLLYNSPLADGTILDTLPYMDVPAPFDPPTPPGEGGPEAGDDATIPDGEAQAALPPDASNPDAPNPDTPNPDAVPPGESAGEAVAEAACNAPATTFQVGDTVVVDFNSEGVLNVLDRPRTSSEPIELLGGVRDNDRFEILEGPVCGQWRGSDVWYWMINYGGTPGWVGEASGGDRWLCPAEEPECT